MGSIHYISDVSYNQIRNLTDGCFDGFNSSGILRLDKNYLIEDALNIDHVQILIENQKTLEDLKEEMDQIRRKAVRFF